MNRVNSPLLSIQGLNVAIQTPGGRVAAIKGLNLDLQRGENLCLVGESGCGKSLTALSILGLLPDPPISIHSGSILFNGRDLLSMDSKSLRKIRGRRISMVFQEPIAALNPVFTIGDQISEAIIAHRGPKISRTRARAQVLDLLDQVGIPDPEKRLCSYPHQLSGGLCQRAMIAMALSCNPDVLIADEPTTALDVTIQAQILDLLEDLRIKRGLSVLLITHNLAVVAQVARRVAIMYAGRMVEEADAKELFEHPLHPYTRGLMASIPSGIPDKTKRLKSIPGVVPQLGSLPSGCAFHTRCPRSMDICGQTEPVLKEICPGHKVSCHLY